MANFDHSSGKLINVGDTEIYFEITGNPNGKPLILLHGGLGNILDLNIIINNISNDYKFIGIDFRGHGKSNLGTSELTYKQHQSDVERVINHLGLDSYSILGFSDGGTVGYHLAIENPSKIKSLTTIGAKHSISTNESVYTMLSNMTSQRWIQRFPESVDYYNKVNPNPNFDKLVKSVVNLWTDTGISGYPGNEINKITNPTLIVRGDKDMLFPLNTAIDFINKTKNVNLFNIPFIGHEVHKEAVELFLPVFQEFLVTN